MSFAGSGRSSVRLFLGLWPDAAARQNLAQLADDWHWPGDARRYAPQDWHVTLHFLGNVPSERVDEVGAGLVVDFMPFRLTLDQPESWHGGLAVLCPSVVPDALLQLHAALAQAVRALELPVENRPFRPHLTLARQAARSQAPNPMAPVQWQVGSYVLACSTGDVARRYQCLREYRST